MSSQIASRTLIDIVCLNCLQLSAEHLREQKELASLIENLRKQLQWALESRSIDPVDRETFKLSDVRKASHVKSNIAYVCFILVLIN